MLFILGFLFVVLVPGFLLATGFGIKYAQLLFSVTLSLTFFVGLTLAGRYFSLSTDWFTLLYGVSVSLFLLIIWFCQKTELQDQINAIRSAMADRSWLYGLIAVVFGYLAWYYLVGPYTEVPADFYFHLEFLKRQLGIVQQGSLGAHLGYWSVLTQQSGFWYLLLAYLIDLIGLRTIDILYSGMLLFGLLFITSIYVFSYRLFRPLPLSDVQRSVAAVLSCFFVVIQMGVTAFSFIRYYNIAPVIVNYIVFLTALVCLMEIVEQKRLAALKTNGPLWGLCFITALVIHNQEGLFILVITVATVGWLLINHYLLSGQSQIKRLAGLCFFLVAIMSIAILALILAFDQASIPVSPEGKVVALPITIPDFGPLHILNPYYQFYQTVTIWGFLVALLFFMGFSFFRHQPLLVAGMLSPLVTVFNPVFVDVYLRIEGDFSLWRLCFLLPLYFVAATFIVSNVYKWPQYGVWKRNTMAFVVAALVLLPTSNSISKSVNSNLRTTNQSVAQENSYHQWLDLIEALNGLRRHDVLTDPVTGYIVSGLTPHYTFRHKFYPTSYYRAFSFNYDDYSDFPLSRYRGWLLIVNLRDGAESRSGALSGHWPEDVLKVSDFYSEKLLRHLDQNPDRFETVWTARGITVYRIL